MCTETNNELGNHNEGKLHLNLAPNPLWYRDLHELPGPSIAENSQRGRGVSDSGKGSKGNQNEEVPELALKSSFPLDFSARRKGESAQIGGFESSFLLIWLSRSFCIWYVLIHDHPRSPPLKNRTNLFIEVINVISRTWT